LLSGKTVKRKDIRVGFQRHNWSYRHHRGYQVDINLSVYKEQRHHFVKKLVEQLELGKRILNLDETSITTLTGKSRSWGPKQTLRRVVERPTSHRITLTAILDQFGTVYWNAINFNSNADTSMMTLLHLHDRLTLE
jgi:hypothetical protein